MDGWLFSLSLSLSQKVRKIRIRTHAIIRQAKKAQQRKLAFLVIAMSMRSKKPTSDAVNSADEIRKVIENAKLANDSFFLSNPSLAAIEAPPTVAQRAAENARPFRVQFEQIIQESTIMKGEFTVKITITLSGGVFARLRPMIRALSKVMKPAFAANGFEVRMRGKMFKVCSAPRQSTGKWAFEKMLEGSNLAKAKKGDYQFWLLPGGAASPLALLASAFPTGMIDDTKYTVVPVGADTIGQIAMFDLKLV